MDLGSITPILSTASEGILLADARRRITYVNQAFTDLTGFAEADLLGRTCRALQGPLTSQDTVGAIRAALDAGKPFYGEILNYTKSGETFWNDLAITPVFDQGVLTGFLGVTRDSSARKAAALMPMGNTPICVRPVEWRISLMSPSTPRMRITALRK